jgi:hypothetical protein
MAAHARHARGLPSVGMKGTVGLDKAPFLPFHTLASSWA